MTVSFYNLYPKLAPVWSKQANRRDSTTASFLDHGKIHNDVAKIMCQKFKNIHETGNLVHAFRTQWMKQKTPPFEFHDNSMFIYEFTPYDCLPKSSHMNQLNQFMLHVVLPLFPPKDKSYLKKHFNFSSCFFVWFLCTPQFFYANHSKSWECCLLKKKRMEIAPTPQKQAKNQVKTTSHSEDTMIPSLEKSVDEKLSALTSLLEISFDESVSSFEIHGRVTNEMTEQKLGKNKYKRCLKLYQSYQKEHKKLTSLKNVTNYKKMESGIHRSNGTFVPFKQKVVVPEMEMEERDLEVVIEEVDVVDAAAADAVDVPDDWESLGI